MTTATSPRTIAARTWGPHALRRWIKERRTPLARLLYTVATAPRRLEIPLIPGLHRGLYEAHKVIAHGWSEMTRLLYWTPLFKSRLRRCGARLYLYGGLPVVTGPVSIDLGSDCRISGRTTISGRTAAGPVELILGDNVGLGWQTGISVGTRVVMGDNVRLGGRAYLAGFPGHPVNAAARAAGKPDTADQIGDIILEDDVWLGAGSTVTAGVTIGRGTIVGAGSVVTRDLPPGVLAAGVPARVIRPLGEWKPNAAASFLIRDDVENARLACATPPARRNRLTPGASVL